jgi:hypothetical protein
MSQKFKSDIETQAGLIDSFGFTGTAGQVLSSTGTKTEWITPPQTPGGGGSSQVFYFNGGTVSSVGGYYQMSPVANTGTAADFSINANGYIASFLTDVASPNQLNIPAGNWNFEIYFNASSSGGSPSFYVELYKYSSGGVFTLIASSSAAPEGITNGTAIDAYFTPLAVPATTLLVTDRLAVRVYVTHSGRTITMHTQNGHLSEVITTFSTGLTALNGLTKQVQYFAPGTAGTDFNISSATDTHTFNLPTASAVNRGALSSADWTTFNSKANASGTTNYVSKFTGTTTLGNSLIYDNGTNVGIGTVSPAQKLQVEGSLLVNSGTNTATAYRDIMIGGIGGWISGESHCIDAVFNSAASPTTFSRIESFFDGTNGKMRFRNLFNASAPKTDILMTIQGNGNVGIGTDSPSQKLEINGTAYASSDFRAPIFYDSNNTAYYTDPASTSNLASTYIAGHYYGSGNSSNILIKTAANSSEMGILGQSSSGAFRFQLYGDAGSYGFLNGDWAAWDIRKGVNSNMYLNNQSTYYYGTDTAYLLRAYGTADMRAPIFYDLDNTAYYVNPNGTSSLSLVIADNTIKSRKAQADNDYTTAAIWTESYSATTTGIAFHISGNVGKFLEMRTDGILYWANAPVVTTSNISVSFDSLTNKTGGTGSYITSGDFRAPIFYDSNDTNYYGDFASTSRQYQAISFGDSSRYSAINTTINGAGAGDKLILYGGASNYDARLLVGADYDMLFKSQGNTSGKGSFKFYSGSTSALAMQIDASQNTTVYGGVYAPIFYDSNNTSYYLDAAGTSVLSSIDTGTSGTYNTFRTWTLLTGDHGFYSSVNSAHISPNNGSYGAWRISGSRNGYNGIEFAGLNNGQVILMIGPNSNISGLHNASYGWQVKWESGTLYVGKNTYGGNEATVLDSVNFTNYAWPLEGSWKPASLASSTRLRGATSPDGGEFGLAYSGGQIHPYADGFFYQNEGAYRVIDTNSVGSYAPSLTGAGASGTWNIATTGDTTGNSAGFYTTFLGNNSSNISSGYSRVIRNENGNGGNPSYAPILHLAASDTMWQIAAGHGGSTNLVWRSGYSGTWSTPWWSVLHSGLSTMSASGDFRAPIFYDSDNTGYYLDPNGSSYVSGNFKVQQSSTSGIELVSPTGTQSLWIRAGYDTNGAPTPVSAPANITFQSSGNSGGTFTFVTGNDRALLISGTDSTASGSFRAPIFYDSGNTGYYLDLNGTSNIYRAVFDRLTIQQNVPQIDFVDNDQGETRYIHCNGGSLGFLGNTGSWILRTTNSAAEVYGQMYADIYYDRNDTNYYGDFASTSNFNKLLLNSQNSFNAATPGLTSYGLTLMGGTSDYANGVIWTWGNTNAQAGVYVQSSGSYGTKMFFATTDSFATGSKTGMSMDHNGTVLVTRSYLQSDSSLRAPIFYDSINTAYYLDPAGGSVIRKTSIVAIGSAWDDGLNLFSSNEINRWNFLVDSGASDSLRIAYNTVEALSINTSRNITAAVDFRAPIFYDSNNTYYYLDPNGTSNLGSVVTRASITNSGGHSNSYIQNELPAANNGAGTGIVTLRAWCSEPGITWDGAGFGYNVYNDGVGAYGFSRPNTSFGQAYMRMLSNGTWYFLTANTSGTRYTNMELNPNGNVYFENIAQSQTSLRAPIFYDTANTAYYLDPAGTSKLNTAEATGYVYASNYVQSATAMYSPVYYDGNNSSYYFDGSSTGDSIRCAGDIVAYYSDERLKDKKGNIENALEKVLSLNGFYYEPNEVAQELGYKKRLEVGVSAQEVEAVLPELIRDAPIGQGYKTLDYGKLTPLLIEAIKEQQKQIEELKELVNKLINK